MSRVSGSFLLAALVAFALVQPAIGQSGPALGPDQVVLRIPDDPGIIHPLLFGFNDWAWSVGETLFTRNVEWGLDGKPFPLGVEYLPSLKDGTWKIDGERMTLLWRLKPRRWHDGRPVTCGDFVFTVSVIRNELVESNLGWLRRYIAGVSCPRGAEGREVTIIWKERAWIANLLLDELGLLPRHVLEPYYRRDPARLTEAPYGNDPQATIGDGPYRTVAWDKGKSITVEAVPNHPLFGTPRIKRIIFRVLDTPAFTAALKAGTIDEAGVWHDEALEMEQWLDKRYKVLYDPPWFGSGIAFNLDNPVLQDLRVRRAIAHGINRTQIMQQLYGGKWPIAHSYLPPPHPGYTTDVQKYSYDPARARALLRAAGFTPGPDGIMQDAAGKRLALELSARAEITFDVRAEQIVQQQLRQVGVEVVFVNFPGRIFRQILRRRQFKAMAITGLGPGDPRGDCDGAYTSDAIPSQENEWTGGNVMGYRNPEMDRVCKAVEDEIDPEIRRSLFYQSQRIFARDLPALPLYWRAPGGYVVKAGLGGFQIHPAIPRWETWNAYQWYWK